MRILITIGLLLIMLLSSGCATIFNGSTETIHVRSEEPNTVFMANNRELGRGTSAVATLNKKELKSTILRAEKTGCNATTMPIMTAFDATSLLGILLDFGIVSILIVDWASTGAVNKASQTNYILTPSCN